MESKEVQKNVSSALRRRQSGKPPSAFQSSSSSKSDNGAPAAANAIQVSFAYSPEKANCSPR